MNIAIDTVLKIPRNTAQIGTPHPLHTELILVANVLQPAPPEIIIIERKVNLG